MGIFNENYNMIAEDMEKVFLKSAQQNEERVQQIKKQAEQEFNILKSLEQICKMAESYEDIGMLREANLLTELLEAYASGDQDLLNQNLVETESLLQAPESQAPESQGSELQINDEDAVIVENMLSSFDDEE